MRTVQYCKDTMGTMGAARPVYIESGTKEPMHTIPMVLGRNLVDDGTPCVVYAPDARVQVASLQQRQPLLALWQKIEIAV